MSFTNKVGKIKKDIKSSSDKEKIKELELKLAKLIAQANQDEQGGKAVSGADLERARQSVKGKPERPFRGYAPRNAPDDFFMTDEEMAELRAQGKSRRKTLKRTPLKKGGGKIYASMDKKYGGGIYPRKPTNG